MRPDLLLELSNEELNQIKPIELIHIPEDFTGNIEISYEGKVIDYRFENNKLSNVSFS